MGSGSGSVSDQNRSLFRFPARALGHVLFDNTHAFGACQPSLGKRCPYLRRNRTLFLTTF